MTNVTTEELNQSINAISNYRDRLKNELIESAKKLQIPNNKIRSQVERHPELIKLNQIIDSLVAGIDQN